MRILIAHNVSEKRNTGMSRMLGFLHDPIVEQGHHVDYSCSGAVPHSANGRLSRFAFPFLVARKIREGEEAGTPYDIVNVHEPSGAVVSILRKRGLGPITVAMSHAIERREWQVACKVLPPGKGRPTLKSRLLFPLTSLWQSEITLRLADHVFCLSTEHKDFLIHHMNRKESEITRLFPGVDSIYSRTAAKRTYSGTNRLLFAGTWQPRKGSNDVVVAFSRLREMNCDVTLTILGGGKPADAILSDFPESVRPHVICLQTKNEKENAEAYANADIYLLPSYSEGTPLTLLEAMGSGLPVITTSVCGMKDVIQNGKNGLLTDPGQPGHIVDSYLELRNDSVLRTKIGRGAAQDAQMNYTWKKAADRVLQVYEKLTHIGKNESSHPLSPLESRNR